MTGHLGELDGANRHDAQRRLDVGVVAIGRNEGERLERCLRSVSGRVAQVVYVDSGSTDGSVQFARSIGAVVVELDPDSPFTAARARNAGWGAMSSALKYVQFVDGDCEVVPTWIARAARCMDSNDVLGVVCGRRRERYPDVSIYNALCDLEWDTPIGESLAFGGDALIRLTALQQVGGYRESLIAGEEPELGLRLRRAGCLIRRIDEEMTIHDAAITRFSQWWRRTVRAGYAFAEGASLHGGAPERHWVLERRRAIGWGIGLPLTIALAWLAIGPVAALALLLYPVQMMRVARRHSGTAATRLISAMFIVIGKFAEASGAMRFYLARLADRPLRLIEYK